MKIKDVYNLLNKCECNFNNWCMKKKIYTVSVIAIENSGLLPILSMLYLTSTVPE